MSELEFLPAWYMRSLRRRRLVALAMLTLAVTAAVILVSQVL